MKTFPEAVEAFLAASRAEWGSPGAQKAMKRMQELGPRASRADLDAAAALVSRGLAGWPHPEVGQIALTLGMLVEMGADARPHVAPLLARARATIEGTHRFAQALGEALPDDEEPADEEPEGDVDEDLDDDEDDLDDDDDGFDEDEDEHEHEHGEGCDHAHEHDEALEAAYVAVAARLPEEAGAAHAFGPTALALIALLSRSPEGRALARADAALVEQARLLASERRAPPHAEFLAGMLQVLDGERLLVLHPGAGRGFEVAITGVADNFQLHTLLGAALVPRGLPGQAPAAAVAACARGEGPQEAEGAALGVFNLLHWTALAPDGTLPPDAASEHWVWNEGAPADIRPFEGRRVVVLGPPPYERSWNAARLFDAMRADATVERELDAAEVQAWLRKLGGAPRPVRPS